MDEIRVTGFRPVSLNSMRYFLSQEVSGEIFLMWGFILIAETDTFPYLEGANTRALEQKFLRELSLDTHHGRDGSATRLS